MKKLLLIPACLLALFVILLLLLPIFLRDNVTGIIERQSTKYIDAELHIGEIRLSMFKSFPDLNVGVRNVTVSGKKEFAGDTLLHIPLFSASVNVISLLKGDEVVVNRILLKDTRLLAQISKTGRPNWDILLRDSVPATPAEQDDQKQQKGDGSERIRLNDIRIKNLTIDYQDATTRTHARIGRLDMEVSGDFAEVQTVLKTKLAVEGISFRQGNTLWVNNTDFHWESYISANFRDKVFEIQENRLSLNKLQLALNGHIGIREEGYDLDLRLKAPDTRFESLLALVPQTFAKELKDLETTGDFNLDVTVQGSYHDGHLPRFQAVLGVNNATVKYAGLPESINRINLNLQVGNPGGLIDSTRIDLKQLSFSIADNSFAMNLSVVNPNNPYLRGGIKGSVNFANLKKALPLEEVNVEGSLHTDLTFNGKYAYIEKKEYEKFKAEGKVRLERIVVKNPDFPQGISIPSGELTVTPSALKISNVEARVLSSDFTLNGNFSNYLPYLLKNQTLKGDFSLTSQCLNLNELAGGEKPGNVASATQPEAAPSAESATIPDLPANLDLHLRTNVKKLLFDRLTIQNIKGDFRLANGTATFPEVYMELLNGTLRMSGKYGTTRPGIPQFNLKLNVADADIHSAYESFSFIRQSIPIAMSCEGRVSADCKLAAELLPDGSMNLKTADGSGYIASQGILINQNPTMDKLASLLKNEELNRIKISSMKIEFEMQQGNLTVKPFKTTLAGNQATIYGYQSVDGNMAYTLSLNVKRKYFGKDIENVLKNIPGSSNIESLDVDVKIEGTPDKPEVKPDLSKALKTIQKEAENDLKKKALKAIQKEAEKELKKAPKTLMKELNKLFK